MNIYVYNDREHAVFTAVGLAMKDPDEAAVTHERAGALGLFDRFIPVQPNRKAAEGVLNALYSKNEAYLLLMAAYNGSRERGRWILRYMEESQRHGQPIADYHTCEAVQRVKTLQKQTSHEVHRFKGLLRFREMASGILFAECRPDHDILQTLALYFCRRLRSEQWMIHDRNRGKSVAWDGKRLSHPDHELLPPDDTTGAEDTYHDAWKTFFKSVAVEGRENRRLQQQHIPLRYRQEVIELNDLPL